MRHVLSFIAGMVVAAFGIWVLAEWDYRRSVR